MHERVETVCCYCTPHRLSAVARGMGSPRHAANRRRRARKGPEPVRVLAPSDNRGGAHGGERANDRPAVVPSSRRGEYLHKAQAPRVREGRPGCLARQGKWPPRGTGTTVHHLALPSAWNCRFHGWGSAQGEQARLAKTVKVQVLGGSSPWIRPSAPGCGDTSKAAASIRCTTVLPVFDPWWGPG